MHIPACIGVGRRVCNVCVSVCSYVKIAVRVASNPDLRATLRARVLQNVHKLFHQDASVQAWQDTLERLATTARKSASTAADATKKEL